MRKRMCVSAVFTMAFITLTVVPSMGQHTVDLATANTVPSYCQEDNIWCGAATTQMILEGYPGGVDHVFPQADIWDTIQVYKNDAGVNWATDPDGLDSALMHLGGDPGVHWNIFAKPDSQRLMYSVTYWMTIREYPTATLVYGFQHWITIVGFETDVNPTTNSTITLNQIEVIDPWDPPCATAANGGVQSTMTGANWFANYWYAQGNVGSKWDGNFIAVIEPPPTEGVAEAPKMVIEGKIITPEEALRRATAFVKEDSLFEKPPYIRIRKAQPLQPMLVNPEQRGYYIVPFGYRDGRIAEGAVLINAYTGEFQEAGVFRNPVEYVTADEAIRIARSQQCICGKGGVAELVFRPSSQTTSRFLPVWKVTVKKRSWIFWTKTYELYVDQLGRTFVDFLPLPLGD